MKKLLVGIVVLLIIVVGALFAVPPLIGNSLVKSQVVEAVREATGREVTIGDLSVSVLPSISLGISDLTLANGADMSTPEMVTLGRLDLDLQLFPLIGKAVMVDRLVISDVAIFLEKNGQGAANWVFDAPAGAASGSSSADEGAGDEAGDGGLPLSDLRLADVKIENAIFSYIDQTTGQVVEARDIAFQAALPNLAGTLALDGQMSLNDKPVTLKTTIQSPEALLSGEPANLVTAVTSELINLNTQIALAQKPQPAVDGATSLEIGSVGALLDWLGQPLPADQPDPGPVKFDAKFETQGDKVVLQEVVLKGAALDLRASGSLESLDGKTKVALQVESGELDIDRYLPPPKPGAAPAVATKSEGMADKPRGHPLDAVPDEAIDLSALRDLEADIKIAMGGIKASGYEIGKIAFTTTVADGKLQANLEELALYGGQVTGVVGLDATTAELGVTSDIKLDQVDLGKLAAVGAEGEAPIAGIASGSLTAKAVGESPRALVQALQAALVFKLGKLDVKNAAAGALSGVDLAVDLPGLSQSPSVKGTVIYNKRKVELDIGLDPIDQVLAGETFALTAKIDSELVKFGYDGDVQQQPLPGLDGTIKLESVSVGKLAAWLGQPLPADQPDPGPLKIAAVLKAAGEAAVLESATIEGEALQASASGSVDISGEVNKIKLDLKAGMLDIDRYLPPPAPAAEAPAAAPESEASAASAPAGGNPLDAIPDEPIDLAGLRGTEADISVALDGLKASGFALGATNLGITLKGGKLAVAINELALYGGQIKGSLDLDGSSDSLLAASDLAVTTLNLGDLARAAGQDPAPAEGILTAKLTAQTQGASPRALVGALVTNLDLQLRDAALAALPDVAIGDLNGKISIPGLDKAVTGEIALTLNGEPLTESFTIDSPQKALAGNPFALKIAMASQRINLSVDGTVQQDPVPGLDGTLELDIASVGELAAWLGQPLPADQPDPGPLKVSAVMAADGGKVAITKADITGKAAQASASGSFDGTGEIAKFEGRLDVAKLDLNAYLPPSKKAEEEEPQAATGGGAQGWSEEPIDASGLRQAEGTLAVTLANVLYKEVEVTQATANVTLAGGVLNADVSQVQFNPGAVTAKATLDGSSGDVLSASYAVSLKGIESKPFLLSFADIDWLSGKLNYETQGAAVGANQKQLVGSLNGDGAFSFLDGAVEGVDLAGTLRNLGKLGQEGGEKPKTDFTELTGTYTIRNGLLNNPDLQMLAPLVRVTGAGDVPLPARTVDYRSEAKLVASLEGQGSKDPLAGIPVPVHIFGPWDKVDYKIDFASLVTGAAVNPDNLKGIISGEGAEGGAAGLIEGVLGGGTKGGTEGGAAEGGATEGGAAGGLINNLLGGGQTQQAPAAEDPAPEASGPAPTTTQEQPAPAQKKDPAKDLLKGLLGN